MSWGLEVDMPGPFLSFLSVLSIFSLELSLECYTGQDFYQSAYLSATAPFAFALLVCLFTFAAKLANGKVQNLASRLLLLSYVVLPPTLLKLFQVKRAFSLIICCFLLPVSIYQIQPVCPVAAFSSAMSRSRCLFFIFTQALDCIELAGRTYLRVDTSVSCDGSKYATFAALDATFITAYMAIPLLWLLLLWRRRKSLSPPTSDPGLALYLRSTDESLKQLRFLFQDYTPSAYHAEVFEM